MLFVTSDWHLGHERIVELCDRPFNDVNHMNEVIISNHNAVVRPDDDVLVLGDVVMGQFEKNIELVKRFNGRLVLVPGNHDRISRHESLKRFTRFYPAYADVFFEIFEDNESLALGTPEEFEVNISHFPYDGDSQDEDRYKDLRPIDDGNILLHGHTHSKNKVSWSKRGALQIHCGVDAWNYFPVSEHQILQLIKEYA